VSLSLRRQVQSIPEIKDLGKLYTTLARRTCHVNIYLMIRLRTVMLNPSHINCGKVTNTLQKRQFILPCYSIWYIGCPIMNITKVQNQGSYIYVSLFIGHVSMSTTGLSSNVSFWFWAGPMRGGFSRYIGPVPGEPRRGLWISEGPHILRHRYF